MRISTDALVDAVTDVAGLHGTDAYRLTGEQAAHWLARVSKVRHAADALIAGLAQRIEELSAPDAPSERFDRSRGFSSPAQLVSRVGNLTPADADRLLGIGRALVAAPVERGEPTGPLARAVSAGEIGTEKASIVRRCMDELGEADIEFEAGLVRAARALDIPGLRALCLREVARRNHEAMLERERRQRASRSLRFFTEPDGMVALHGRLDPATAAPVRAWIDAEVRRTLADQRDLAPAEQRDPAQAAADALATMARHMLGCENPAAGVKTTVLVRVSKEELESGVGVAECDGLETPVSIQSLRAVAVDAEVLPVVMGGESLPLDLGRARRLFTRAQRLALAQRDGGCARCGAPVARCDVHHIRWWSRGGGTDLDNGVLLCVGCHHRLHDFGWDVKVRNGEVWFIPPSAVDPERKPQPSHRMRLRLERDPLPAVDGRPPGESTDRQPPSPERLVAA